MSTRLKLLRRGKRESAERALWCGDRRSQSPVRSRDVACAAVAGAGVERWQHLGRRRGEDAVRNYAWRVAEATRYYLQRDLARLRPEDEGRAAGRSRRDAAGVWG